MSTARTALDALFDEGVNFADYDEGKMNTTQPDGYEHRAVDVAEIRRRAVDRALQGVVVYGVWEEDPDDGKVSLVELYWDKAAAERCCADPPTYNAGTRSAERAIYMLEEHTIT